MDVLSVIATLFLVPVKDVDGFSSLHPTPTRRFSTSMFHTNELGAGGMADTRNPDAKVDADPRKSISAAPSFEEYLKERVTEGSTAAASTVNPKHHNSSTACSGEMNVSAAYVSFKNSQTKS